MSKSSSTRRQFLKTSAAVTAGATIPYIFTSKSAGADVPKSKNDRPRIAGVGLGGQGSGDLRAASGFGDIVAVCDVDKNVRDQAKASFGSTPRHFEDYQDLLARKEVDVITIGAPDHWHTKMVIDACRAGKDVYCEKPLTLTIDEGKKLRDAVKETGRVVQVGSWQRADHRFRQAVEMVRQGRIGNLQKVEVVLGKNVGMLQPGGDLDLVQEPLSAKYRREFRS